jgi:hypothetical protein
MDADDLDLHALRAYARLLINRWDCFLAGTSDHQWRCLREPLTETQLRQAVAGQLSLGSYAVDRRGFSRWACLDLDDNVRGDRFLPIIERLDDPSTCLLEPARRGFHLWLFVEPSPWFVVQRWAKELADGAGLRAIEIFPKGEGLNGVRLPLSRHPKTGQVYPIIDAASGELLNGEAALRFIARRQVGQIAVPYEQSVPRLVSPPPSRSPRGDRTDHRALVAEIERYTRLRFYGPEQAVGRCPLHDDQHPSLGVLRGYWRCFAGCGEGGVNAFRARMREKGGRSWPQQR